MNSLFAGNGTASQLITMLLVYGVVIGGMYLLLFRPQQKKRKQEEEMRNSVQIGDEIVTIGGIVGRVVSIKEDSESLILETGSEKIRIKKWPVGEVVNKEAK